MDCEATGGSGRRLVVAIGLAAAILTVLALFSPAVSITGAACPITGCDGDTGGGDTTVDYTLTINIHGVGTVKQGTLTRCTQTSGTNASTKSCGVSYPDGSAPTLTTVGSGEYAFQGWSGACSGSTCQPTMDGDKTVTATFADVTPPGQPSVGAPAQDPVQSTTGGGTSLGFTGDGTSYVCRMDVNDVAGATGCSSPFNTGSLATGTHTAYVWAKDGNGNVSSPGTRAFKVVNLPDTTLGGTPTQGAVTSTRPTAFTYGSPTGTTFVCTLDGVGIPCNADLNPVDGAHTLSVRAGISPFDSTVYTDPTPATRSWTVDTKAPDTAISQAPPAKTSDTTAEIRFAGTDPAPGTALHYECKLDSAAFAPCTSPVSYNGLSTASHSFSVRAIDAAGNVEAAPATRAWTIVKDADGDNFDVPQDCDDTNPSIHPGAAEVLDDGIDQNCDGDPGTNFDRDRDGSNRPADCNDANPSIKPGVPEIDDNDVDENCDGIKGVNLDRDGDGVQRPSDCDDANAAIHPGAYDKPGDTIDQDCVGGPADYLRPGTSLSSSWAIAKGRTRFPVFRISGAPKGAKVVVSCKGKGCTFKSKNVKLKRGKADLRKLVKKGIPVGRGATIDVRTTVTDMLVSIIRVKVAKNGAAKTAKLCIRPGSKKTFSCG